MKSIIKEILNKSKFDFIEVHIDKNKINSIVMSNGKVEDISNKITFNGNIRVLDKGKWAFISFNKIDNINSLIEQIEKIIRLMNNFTQEKRKIKSYKPIVNDFKTSYKIDSLNIPLSEKYDLILSYDRILQNFKKVVNRKITYLDRREEIYYGNSEGSLIYQNKLFTGISFVAAAREGNNIQIAHNSEGGYRGYESIKNLHSMVEECGKKAELLLKAEPVESGKYTVILDQKLAGVFAHEAFGHLSEADFIFENPRFMDIMKIGRKFGIEELNIIDDGNIEGEAGFIFVDDEGVLPQKTYLIKNGILNSRLHSRETAERMNEEVTGNARALNSLYQPLVRMSNTYIDNGNTTFEEMISDIEDGIYATDFVGGQTNLEMFTFSAGIGYKIKNGKLDKPLKNVVLTGNVFQTLNNIEYIGNDLKLYGGLGGCGKGGQFPLPVATGAPHIRIKNVLIGGI